jgi:hypothetical protein
VFRYLAVTVGVVALLLTGCGSGDDETPDVVSAGSGPSDAVAPAGDRAGQAERYRDCLLENGVTLLDQPTEEGLPQVDKARTTVDVLAVAQEKCRTLVPAGGDAARPAAEDIQARARYAACIRQNGVPEYPDPDPVTGDARISEELAARLKDDPRMRTAEEACQGLGGPSSGKGKVGG